MQRGRNFQFALLSATLIVGWSAQVAQAAPPAAEAKGLPEGWAAAAIGTDDSLTDKQSVTVENGKWTIVAGGRDLWGDADGGLMVYRPHTGNGSVSFHLISQTGGFAGGCEDRGWFPGVDGTGRPQRAHLGDQRQLVGAGGTREPGRAAAAPG